jgi:NAD(P)-dependent dehydrogenase (short-subunit alcohol dehydrogenase family)
MTAPAVLITGGTSGIGRATADVLHSRGYRVAVTGQRSESVARAREELPEDVLVLQADARSLAHTDVVMSEVRERFGTLSALCLNAGVSRPATLETADEAAFDEVFAVNTKGQFFTLVKALPLRATPGMGPEEIEAMLTSMAAKTPFGRLGRPEDIAETIAFLASDGAAYITGQEIVVSGGAGLAV